MQTKIEIVNNWLPRYTGQRIENFGKYIILTNFKNYVNLFCQIYDIKPISKNSVMQCATAEDITIINFGMGAPNAATIIDLLTAISPKAVIFLGKCGGLKSINKVGDFILPIAAIRGDGASNDYLAPEVPALPAFALQKAISTTLRDYSRDYWTGTVYTTNRRVWEHDKKFKSYLKSLRVMAIDMESATIFTAAFYNKITAGALLLVSDTPMTPEGVKTEKGDIRVTEKYVDLHLTIGIDSLKQIIHSKSTVKHLKF